MIIKVFLNSLHIYMTYKHQVLYDSVFLSSISPTMNLSRTHGICSTLFEREQEFGWFLARTVKVRADESYPTRMF